MRYDIIGILGTSFIGRNDRLRQLNSPTLVACASSILSKISLALEELGPTFSPLFANKRSWVMRLKSSVLGTTVILRMSSRPTKPPHSAQRSCTPTTTGVKVGSGLRELFGLFTIMTSVARREPGILAAGRHAFELTVWRAWRSGCDVPTHPESIIA